MTQPLAAQGDLTSAYIRYLQKMEELEGVSRPIWLGQSQAAARETIPLVIHHARDDERKRSVWAVWTKQ